MGYRERLISYAIKYNGGYDLVKKAIENNEEVEIIKCDNAITILDDIYPKELLLLNDPPFVLFYKGNINLLNTKKCSIVGSRNLSKYGEYITSYVANVLKEKYTIVSGLAKGVDGISHMVSLNGGKTIGVIGCGINYVYPKCNAYLYEEMSKNHLIISEYPNEVLPLKYHFPWRNRIIAALGNFIVVTQATQRSGTLITVNYALLLNKDIWVVPYRFNEIEGEGCNKLINEGANILLKEYLDEL